MQNVNLGILAHVDAGKTTLTERILFQTGVIPTFGSVDHGTTHTDSLDLERQRGITIQSAVVSFRIGDLKVNLIDTPGHPDFIAEVERALGVLDGVILVVSAVEGIQPQTRRLFRVIRSKQLPCLLFVNKIDRGGARAADLLVEMANDLDACPLSLSEVQGIGTRNATSIPHDLARSSDRDAAIDVLGQHDPALLDRWVDQDGWLDEQAVRTAVRDQFQGGMIQPVVFGSAITGAGVTQLLNLLPELAPLAPSSSHDCPLSAEVFKVGRTSTGERSVICRIWQGTLVVRDTVAIVRPHAGEEIPPARVTNLSVFDNGQEHRLHDASAGEIVRLSGLADARIGDWLGTPLLERIPAFEPPVFEYQVLPSTPDHRFDLLQALATLADEDPLIGMRIDEVDQAMFIHLYGEVQREVIEFTLQDRFGLTVTFGEPAVICVERLLGPGSAAEIFGETSPPFYATVGFRIRPRQGPQPVWAYTPGKAKRNFFDAAEIGGRATLAQGPHGWPVIDVDVEVTDLIYLMKSVPTDYRKLAALVMADAVKSAGTVVCEPVHRFTLRAPVEHSGGCIHLLSTNRAEIVSTAVADEFASIQGTIPAATMNAVVMALPGLTQGRGDFDTRFHDYQPVAGEPPRRRRTDLNPYNRIEYLSRLSGRF
jgi:ribosomal protection tetracycline resistance protein